MLQDVPAPGDQLRGPEVPLRVLLRRPEGTELLLEGLLLGRERRGMGRAVAWFSVLLLLAAGSAYAGERLTVVTWNLQWFPGGKPYSRNEDKPAHIQKVRDELAQIQPDILFVQEVCDRSALEEALGGVSNLHLHVLSTFTNYSSGLPRIQQVGIASRLPVLSAWAADWNKGFADPPRGYAFAAIMVKRRTGATPT